MHEKFFLPVQNWKVTRAIYEKKYLPYHFWNQVVIETFLFLLKKTFHSIIQLLKTMYKIEIGKQS